MKVLPGRNANLIWKCIMRDEPQLISIDTLYMQMHAKLPTVHFLIFSQDLICIR